ncbi:ferm domain-containing protein 3-like [Dermatophagoides farinae]|uniref:Moesin/ezrin/radixin homolog 1 n=1 Tax=Dermatophagoides farinae TaxID=6954 RepID=A0A9D4SJ17_DERFA|nr:FERM domain-containing protein 5-like [Dermatophagoides farinae]KAH7643000.1 ferm domain-containing protein 3-like [Dermatophagoides farinae]
MARTLLSRFGSKKDLSSNQSEFQCAIRLLDDEEVLQTSFQREQKGQFLLDYAFKTLNLLEKDYFGLRFVDANNLRVWLDPTRSILKQVKNLNPIIFCFRVKFYPANPILLKDELTRYYLYLQLRRDLLNRRLYCLPADAIYLMACVVQSELGDYNDAEHKENYVSTFKIIPNQNEKIELETIEIHMNEMKSLTPADAELQFLERASKLETYGIDPYPVKDHKKIQYLIGINHSGILSFQGNKKVYHFKWNELQKITYEGKMFILHHYSGGKKNLVGFKCPNVSACQNLWRSAVEQRYFFTMNSSDDIPTITTGGGLFSKQCKLRYSGRVEREIIEDMKKLPATTTTTTATATSTINRRHSMNTMPMSMRSFGRSNTAPLPDDGSPNKFQSSFNDDKNPYLNYSIVSEPENYGSHKDGTFQPNCSMIVEPMNEDYENNHPSLQQRIIGLSSTTNPCLPTEFDMRPDVTPTGDEPNTISFETPMVRSSPSQLSTSIHQQLQQQQQQKSSEEETTTNDSDETLEQVSEIVDQTPSTYQQPYMTTATGKHMKHLNKNDDESKNNNIIINNNNNNNSSSISNNNNNNNNNMKNMDKLNQLTKRQKTSKISCGKKLCIMLFTSLLSALIIFILITGFLIIILETDTEMFIGLRKLPEMVIFQRDYYQPIKENIIQSINSMNL